MKKIIPILALLSVFVFLNCSKSNGSEEEVTKIDKSTNLLGTGDSAGDILSNTKYDKLILEIGYVQGFKPTTTAIADLIEFLKEPSRLAPTNLQSPRPLCCRISLPRDC